MQDQNHPIRLIDNITAPTPHNEAKLGDFAPTVIMAGDPEVSKYIAENYLTDAKLVNNVRNIQGYTGIYKDKPLSVMGSGIGQPSIAIYSYELYCAYNVQNIIRIGTMGGFSKDLHLGDIVLAMCCSTDSNFYTQFSIEGSYSPCCNPTLMQLVYDRLIKQKRRFSIGNVLSTDRFYSPHKDIEHWQAMNVLGVDMETATLYCNASFLRKRAISLNIVSNSYVYTDEERKSMIEQRSFNDMIKIAFDTAYVADQIDQNLQKYKDYYTEG